MASKILMIDNPLSAMDIAHDLAPSGFDLVIARGGSPEFAAALNDAEYVVGLGEVKMDDVFAADCRLDFEAFHFEQRL